ncbi:hypothetical protein C8F04DRAFT_1274423 [Mycena alexandri]|uniref:Pali-domain-containing protein n=1 Tax=Mycena alexandri TaxID=1745969 RepID=A0AAD6S6W9_9AGAR|nr:hypothetical protein C8F04DRAFT_1274423 [Mycena alexandri]
MFSWSKILGLVSVGVAAALLGLVAFDVPYFKSVYFLRIDLSNGTASAFAANQTTPFVDLGVLGFCTNLQNGQGLQCSPPKIGYSLPDAGKFIDGTLPPALTTAVNAVTTALTKVLVIHLVAFAIAVLSFAFALLAFLGAPIGNRCSLCFGGFAGSATLVIFDIVFFFLVKKGVQEHGNTVFGNAGYLTLLAFLLLFITPVLFWIGRCFGCLACTSKV